MYRHCLVCDNNRVRQIAGVKIVDRRKIWLSRGKICAYILVGHYKSGLQLLKRRLKWAGRVQRMDEDTSGECVNEESWSAPVVA